jgi:predicted DNA-binding protein
MGDGKRKERVLHTRVPAVLDQELKRLATSLRVPVSNVVRTILEDAVQTIDQVGRAAEDGVRDVAERLSKGRERLKHKAEDAREEAAEGEHGGTAPVAPLQGVIGYQPMRLARAEVCCLSGRVLQPGEEVFLGIRDGVGPRVIIGAECAPWSARGNEKVDDALSARAGDDEQEKNHDDRAE